MSSPDPKSIVQRYYEEIGNQRNLAVADEIFAPEYKNFPDSQPPYGPEGVKQFITSFVVKTFPDLQATIDDIVVEGDTVAVAVTLHATHTSPINWIPGIPPVAPTGKRFALREFVFWRVSEGKIVERKLVVDKLEMLQQVGGLPNQWSRGSRCTKSFVVRQVGTENPSDSGKYVHSCSNSDRMK